MKCRNCGKNVNYKDKVCGSCGYTITNGETVINPLDVTNYIVNGLIIISMFLPGVTALIFSVSEKLNMIDIKSGFIILITSIVDVIVTILFMKGVIKKKYNKYKIICPISISLCLLYITSIIDTNYLKFAMGYYLSWVGCICLYVESILRLSNFEKISFNKSSDKDSDDKNVLPPI